jgi:hypothetical protein
MYSDASGCPCSIVLVAIVPLEISTVCKVCRCVLYGFRMFLLIRRYRRSELVDKLAYVVGGVICSEFACWHALARSYELVVQEAVAT